MTLTTRRIVTAAAEEAVEGVAESLVLGDTFETLVPGARLSPNIETVPRETSGGTLTEPEDVAGRSSGTMEVPMELAGPSDADPTTASTYAKMMRACGMKETAVKCVVVASVTTPGATLASRFSHNEVVTFATSTATGRVIGEHDFRAKASYDTDLRMTYLFVEQLTGTIVVGDASATGTSGTVVALQATDNGLRDAIAYEPWDLLLKTQATGAISGGGFTAGELLTGSKGGRARIYQAATASPIIYELLPGAVPFDPTATAEVVTGASSAQSGSVSAAATNYAIPTLTIASMLLGSQQLIYGSRGNWTANLTNGQNAGLTFNMLGAMAQPIEVLPPVGAPGVRAARPPKVSGLQVLFNGLFSPCFQSLQFQSAHQVSMRECARSETGFESAIITGRRFNGTIDPETVAEGIFPILGNAWDKTSWYTEVIVGDDTLEDGNSFVFRGPRTQATGFSGADRNGIPTSSVQLKFAGTGDANADEFFLFQF